MRYTKQHRTDKNESDRDATWQKYKAQTNQLNAHRRGVKSKNKRH